VWDANQQEMVRLQNSVAFQELEDEIHERKQTMEQASAECEKWNELAKQTDALIVRITTAQKIDSLKWIILEQNINRSLRVQQLIEELEGIRGEISQLDKLKAYNATLNRAISYVEQLLEQQHISIG
jgi:hypothetical protein